MNSTHREIQEVLLQKTVKKQRLIIPKEILWKGSRWDSYCPSILVTFGTTDYETVVESFSCIIRNKKFGNSWRRTNVYEYPNFTRRISHRDGVKTNVFVKTDRGFLVFPILVKVKVGPSDPLFYKDEPIYYHINTSTYNSNVNIYAPPGSPFVIEKYVSVLISDSEINQNGFSDSLVHSLSERFWNSLNLTSAIFHVSDEFIEWSLGPIFDRAPYFWSLQYMANLNKVGAVSPIPGKSIIEYLLERLLKRGIGTELIIQLLYGGALDRVPAGPVLLSKEWVIQHIPTLYEKYPNFKYT